MGTYNLNTCFVVPSGGLPSIGETFLIGCGGQTVGQGATLDTMGEALAIDAQRRRSGRIKFFIFLRSEVI